MAQFGAGVNPQLGAIDYSAYSQGAAQGSAAIGKGLASLGEDFAQGIKQYQLNKKIASEATTETEALVSQNPEVLKWLANEGNTSKAAQLYKKSLKDGVLSMNDATSLNGAVRSFLNEGARQGEAKRKLAELANDTMRAEAEMIKAQREKVGPPGQVMSLEQIGALKSQGYDVKASPIGKDTFFVTNVSPFAPAAKTEINMGGDSYAKTVGEQAATQHIKNYQAAIDAPTNIQKLDELSRLLAQGDVTTGIGADVINNINRIRSGFLGDKKAGKSVSDTQILEAMLGADVFPMISALGIGARGLDTPAERDFLRSVMTGTKEMDRASLVRLTDIRRNIQERAMDKFKQDYDKGTYKKFFEITGNPVPDFSSVWTPAKQSRLDELRAKKAVGN